MNEAYRTLADPGGLRDYFLKLFSVTVPAEKGQHIPLGLAEGWFELQDALAEDPGRASERIEVFERELSRASVAREESLRLLEAKIDQSFLTGDGPDRPLLVALASAIREQSYLKSLQRDIERIRHRSIKNAG